MELIFGICLWMFLPLAFGILYGLMLNSPSAAFCFLGASIIVTWIRHKKYSRENEEYMNRWRNSSRSSAVPVYIFSFTTFFSSFAFMALPFSVYFLSEFG